MRASHPSIGTALRSAAIGAACAVAFIASVNCKSGGGGGGQTAPTTATSNVSFRMFVSNTPKCTADLRWEWTPVKVSGAGSSSAFSNPAQGTTHYDITPSGGDPEHASTCDFNSDSGLNALALGTWQIRLVDAAAGPIAQCTVNLRAGPNWAGFRQAITTCKETPAGQLGFQYP